MTEIKKYDRFLRYFLKNGKVMVETNEGTVVASGSEVDFYYQVYGEPIQADTEAELYRKIVGRDSTVLK